MHKINIETYASVWDALADTPDEAANWRMRSELMDQIGAIIAANQWTPLEAAQHCGLTLTQINDFLGGHLSRFSLYALVSIALTLQSA